MRPHFHGGKESVPDFRRAKNNTSNLRRALIWGKDIRKERKLNIYNALIQSSLFYGFETHGDSQKIITD